VSRLIVTVYQGILATNADILLNQKPLRRARLRIKLMEIFRKQRCLCVTEACRLVNGFGKREIVCHSGQGWCDNRKYYFGTEDNYETTEACNQTKLGCQVPFMLVRQALHKMEQKHFLKHKKRVLFWDKRCSKAFDYFTFYFIEYKDFENRVLKQTLIPYIA